MGATVGAVLAPSGAELAALLYALAVLGILQSNAPQAPRAVGAAQSFDPLDTDAVRRRVATRLALVHEADYFALLGVTPSATGYDVKRAYLELRRTFDPQRVLTGATADLAQDLDLIIEVLDEAFEVLRDPQRRSRYQRAIQATLS
jgi:hypothetical protein